MAKHFLTVFLLLAIKTLSAQVSATTYASATIVHPVGTEEIADESLQMVLLTAGYDQQTYKGSAQSHQTKQLDLAKFRVINNSFLFSISIVSDSPEAKSIHRMEVNRLLKTGGGMLPATESSESYVVGANFDLSRIPVEKWGKKSMLDIAVNFN